MSSKSKSNKHEELTPAVSETLRLYHGWLGYLLRRTGEDTLRVKVADITRALDGFTCSVRREGDEYIIDLSEAGKEEAHDRTDDRG